MSYTKVVGDHVQRADLVTAKTIVLATGATHALVSCLTQAVRITLDGTTTPTATKGIRIKADEQPILIPLPARGSLMAIEEAATAVLDIQFIAL